jgi:hypothetical protein
MKPSVGRIVMYRVSEPSAAFNGSETHPAIVTRVHGEGETPLVNLTVFPDLHAPLIRSSVKHSETEPNAWFWPARV